MAKKHIFHRENCDCFVREVIIDILGRTVTLGGQHAFEWFITIYTEDRIIRFEYPNGKTARQEFKKYKRKR